MLSTDQILLELKGTICKIFVIKYLKTTYTVLYISCSCVLALFQNFPKICKFRDITVLKFDSFLYLHGHGCSNINDVISALSSVFAYEIFKRGQKTAEIISVECSI